MTELIQPTPGFKLNPEIDCTSAPDGSGGVGATEADLHNTHLGNWRTTLKMGYRIANFNYLHNYTESITPAVGTRDKFPVDPREFVVDHYFSMPSLSPTGFGQAPIEYIMIDIDFRLNNIRTVVDPRVYFRGRVAVELITNRAKATLYAARDYRDPVISNIGEESLTVPGTLPGGVEDYHRCVAVRIPSGSLSLPGETQRAILRVKYYDFLRGVDTADGPFVLLSDTSQAANLDWLGIKRVYAHHYVDIA